MRTGSPERTSTRWVWMGKEVLRTSTVCGPGGNSMARSGGLKICPSLRDYANPSSVTGFELNCTWPIVLAWNCGPAIWLRAFGLRAGSS